MNVSLTDLEVKRVKKFKRRHYEKCFSECSIILTETGIGIRIEVRCNGCSKIKDISDYESW